MARNAIESDFRTSKMAAGGHFVKKIKNNNLVLYGSEMARNAIESEFRTSKMADRSEMVRNAIQNDFRTSKMAAEKFQKKTNLCIDLKWPEMQSKVNFGHPKWAPGAILWKKNKKVSYWSEMARNATESDFRTSKMAAGSHFVKKIAKIKIVVLIWNGMKCDTKWFLGIQNGNWWPFKKKNLYKKSCASDLNNVRTDSWPTTTWYTFTFGQYIYI